MISILTDPVWRFSLLLFISPLAIHWPSYTLWPALFMH
jgi:hypothetical protein